MMRVGRYELAGEIGRGASGTVYRATDPAIGRTVAVKIIRLGDLADPAERTQLRDRLFREARAAGALLHPNIVTIFDAGEDVLDGSPIAYIAMELVEGQPLNERWNPASLTAPVIPNDALFDVLRQTAAALDFAHSKGIVHRDVKPANILITGADPVQGKILDFGIAKLTSQQMTHSGTLVGTPNYMSPEQIEGAASLDGRSDQFSLAIVAYELLTGEKPFRGTSLPSLLYQITQQSPQAAHLLNPSLPASASAVIQRSLSKHPVARFRNCTAFVEELERSLAAKPDWHALPAGSSADMPTIATQRPQPILKPGPALPKPPAPAQRPAALPTSHPPLRLDERPRPGLHWAAIILIPALVIAGMFAYWVFDDSTRSAPAESVSAANDGVRPTPMPSDTPPVALEPDPTAEGETDPNLSVPPATEPASGSSLPNFDSGEPTLVQFITQPSGARVSIDNGNRTCTTPCSVLLERGPHTATYTLETYRALTRNLDVPKQTQFEADLERATGTLMLRSTPASATIIIDGNTMTQRTPAVITLPVGKHRLRLLVEGKPPYEEAFELKDQVISTLNIEW